MLLYYLCRNDLEDCLKANEDEKGESIEIKKITEDTRGKLFYNKIALVIDAHKRALEFSKSRKESSSSRVSFYSHVYSFSPRQVRHHDKLRLLVHKSLHYRGVLRRDNADGV